MKIKEVLGADWTVDRFEVTVRDSTGTYVMGYSFGKDIKPGRSEKFMYETKAGDMYYHGMVGNDYLRKLYVNKIIQYRQIEKKAAGKGMCVGVLLDEIPKEILELEVDCMRPCRTGTSDGMHGYKFECKHPMWLGIPGESVDCMKQPSHHPQILRLAGK